ncbi:cell division protein ZapA [Desulfoplanes sp.]
MAGYRISLLGLDTFFRTDASPERVDRAKTLLEERFQPLMERGRNLSKEKLLLFLALSLADDFLQCNERLQELEDRLQQLLHKMDSINQKDL